MTDNKEVITRTEAIATIKDIQTGSGVNREVIPVTMRGEAAKEYWNGGKFGIGAEYGAIAILMNIFDIKADEL